MATRTSRTSSSTATLRSVQREAASGWTPGLTVLTGDDVYHLDRAQEALLGALAPPGEAAMALTVFGAEPVELADVVGAARSAAMFAPRRVVLVRDVTALGGDPAVLADYASKPPASSFLLIRAPELDQRRKLHKALLECGRTLRFASPRAADPRAVLTELAELADERGIQLESQAAAYLAEATAGDLYAIRSELDKLRAFLGDGRRRKATLQQVRGLVAGTQAVSGWEVADAVLVRDRAAALSAVGRLLTQGDEPIRILGGLAWRARTMLQAKALLERGMRPQQVVQATRAWAYQQQLFAGLRRYSLERLLGFPALLLRADRALKSTAVPPRAVLESLVESMTAAETTAAEKR